LQLVKKPPSMPAKPQHAQLVKAIGTATGF
jgi:hypothetical protein